MFEQEPIFTFQSSNSLDEPGTELCVIAYTERVLRVRASLLLDAYSEYRLRFVRTDIIAFARKFRFAMDMPLRSHSNVR